MKQIAHENKLRATVGMDIETKETITAMAKEKNWAFSYMAFVLLQYAIREKQRKKRRNQDDNS